ncbi:MAG: tetratricopeptide repeat protein [Phycisphaerales bacterium]|nr:MAG: tetratricopeptide repeat protein [Phycisphaerales bacterium]
MKDDSSIFDAEPENLDRLFSQILGEPEGQEDPAKAATVDGVLERPGGQIGRYKLLSVLGEGGMGIVYLAQQEQPIKRQVALKVVKPGMDSKRVIARFEAERQALAQLDHPNIAHVHDAGTTEDRRPYFVMEYVKGLSITDHCDHHKLTIEDRLNLFRQVCLAVHHAHQKGIIHRDIKPSNILVSTQDNQVLPKVIDFGVAKALAQPLTERTLVTEQGQLFGTPEYMSPEQVDMANEDIDTRSDVYSLGVLLYVLLTGILPFDSDTLRTGGIDHIRQIIRDTEPKTPSTRLSSLGEEAKKVAQSRRTEIATLAKKLHKELEWIPLKALRKERDERYRSALELADDIENYLKGAPLLAGPPSTVYRLNKFIHRRWALAAGVAVVLIVVIAGVVGIAIFAIKAERRRTEAQAIADFLMSDLITSADPEVGVHGGDLTTHRFLDNVSENLEAKFTNHPLVEASIRETLGWRYRSLSDLKATERHFERALQLRKEHLGPEHQETLNSVKNLGWLRSFQGRNQEAAELLEESMSTCRRVLGEENDTMLSIARALGAVYTNLGRNDEAEQLYLKYTPIARRVLGEKKGLSLLMVGQLGITYEALGRYDEAEHQFLEMLRLREGVRDDDNALTLRFKSFLAGVYTKQKRYGQAERLYLDILPIQRRLLGDEHRMTLHSVTGLARVYTHLGKYDEAEPLLLESLQGRRKVLGEENPDTLASWNKLIDLYEAWDKPEEAEQWRAKLPHGETEE